MKKFATGLLLLLFSVNLSAQSEITTVLLVRHAEKNSTPEDDPDLSPIGQKRAQKLLEITRAADISAIYATQYARTRRTAQPLADSLNKPITTIDAAKSKDLAADILAKHHGKVVLVVGHSNTLEEIITALGGGKIAEIPDEEYDNFYVVTVCAPGRVTVLRLKF